jgi:NTE family protein
MNSTPFATRHYTLPALDSARAARTANEPALVLGGGGSAGNAWLIGVIAGLFEAGLDVTDTDVVIGTSAGATAAAQISGASPTQLLADILSAEPAQRTAARRTGSERPHAESAAGRLRRTNELIAAAADPADMRRRMGAAALELEAASEASGQARWRDTVAARLPGRHWPERTVLMTAVDARTGEPVVFDRHSGVDLVDAVAASCAAATAYGIGEDRFIDGGYRRSSENADLAAGCGRVLVLSPLGGRTRHPAQWGMGLATQVDELRAGGSKVETILPDSDSLEAFGNNMMDLSARPRAARAGYEQGRALAGTLTGFWR